MINSIDMSKVLKISYNVDTLRENFVFNITYKNGEIVERTIPLYIFDQSTKKKVVNNEATMIANYVNSGAKKVSSTPAVQEKAQEPKKEEIKRTAFKEVSVEVSNLVNGLCKTGSWLNFEDLKEILTPSAYNALYNAYRDKTLKEITNSGFSEEKVNPILEMRLNDAKFSFTLRKDGKYALREYAYGPRMLMALNLATLKAETLAPVAELAMQKHLDNNSFFDSPTLKAEEYPVVLKKNIEYARKLQGKEITPEPAKEKTEAKVEVKKEARVIQPFSEKKLDILHNILKGKVRADLSPSELQTELKKLSREYDVSSKSMDVLYQKAKLDVEKEKLEKIARKKLAGRKIPTKRQSRKNQKIEVTKLGNPSLYNKKSYIERSKDLVIPEFKEDWIDYINKNHRQPVPIYGAVDIMVMINNGTNIKEIHKYLDKLHNSSFNAKLALQLLEKYSPYGLEISKKCRKYMMSRPERLKHFVLDKTSFFVEKVDEKSPNEAITELKKLRESLQELSNVELTSGYEEESSKTM